MKSSFPALSIMVLTGLAAAQSTIPTCGELCIAAAVSSATTCCATDLLCQCCPKTKSAIQSTATSCILTNCESNAGGVLAATDNNCAAALSFTSAVLSTNFVASTSSPLAVTIRSPPEAIVTSTGASTNSSLSSVAFSTPSVPPKIIGSILIAIITASSATLISKNSTAISSLVPVTNGAAQLAVGTGSVFAMGIAILTFFLN